MKGGASTLKALANSVSTDGSDKLFINDDADDNNDEVIIDDDEGMVGKIFFVAILSFVFFCPSLFWISLFFITIAF